MLEDYTVMEKKPNGRPVQPPPKGGGTEKKTSDATSKPFGKYTRRREPTGYNNNFKNDPPRKPNPVKGGKFTDKRPRPRSQYYGCGKSDSKVAECEGPEYGSVFIPGSKKQNLNHLLNFHYAPRIGAVGGNNGGSWGRSSPAKWLTTYKHKYNKEHFLQANCQFVVKEDADYTPHFADPDLLVDWNAVEQIRLQSGTLVSCPICLEMPIAAKMTRCGHVYCWPCILHYLALSDKSWRKCPICFEAVHKKDLKSVITMSYSPYNVKEEITFKLMKRERGSLLPIPVEQSDKKIITGLLSVAEPEIDTVYSKLLLAKPHEVMSILQVEKIELKSQLSENEDSPELCFIEQALDLLNEREDELKKFINTSGSSTTVDCGTQIELNPTESELTEKFDSTLVLEEINEEECKRMRYESLSSEGGTISEEDHPNIAFEDLEITTCQTSATKPYYFYQASDGQNLYLHALNIKMLEMQYGGLEQCPLRVTGKIVEKEGGSMTEELRKRLRYLQHLPLTCQFEVAEIDVSNHVSDVVWDHFKDQIETRARRRHRRERDERRRERKINEEVNLMWGRHPAPKIRIESHRQFPLCMSGSDETLSVVPPSPPDSSFVSRSQSMNSISSISTEVASSNTLVASSSVENAGPSFAQMLKDGTGSGFNRAKAKKSPAYKVDPEEWPTPQPAESETELEGYVPVPHYRQSFSDAIALAFEKAEHAEDNTSSKKKKKKKQKILFVTGMACSAK